MTDLLMTTGATFSPCMTYRYRLWREWDKARPAIVFCMLNPSTADDVENDPTIERCQRRAVSWGYGRMDVVNLFALRSTDPANLYTAADPFGPDNLQHILAAVEKAGILVCGWGQHGKLHQADQRVLQHLRAPCASKAHALRINKDGTPAHPLYLPYTLAPTPYDITEPSSSAA